MYCIVLKIFPCRKPHAAPDASMDSTCSAWMPSSKLPGTRNDIYKNLILMIQIKCLCMDRFQVINLCIIIHDWLGFPYLLLCVWAKNVQKKPCIARWNRNWSRIRPWMMGWQKNDAKSSLFCVLEKAKGSEPMWIQFECKEGTSRSEIERPSQMRNRNFGTLHQS